MFWSHDPIVPWQTEAWRASEIGWSDSDERSPQGRVGLAAPGIPRRIEGLSAAATLVKPRSPLCEAT
jgi:hypothetical protein